MSERDLRYDPIDLLISMSLDDTETPSEWAELLKFQMVAKERSEEIQLRERLVRCSIQTNFSETGTQISDQAKERSRKIEELTDELLVMSRSDILKPLVWKAYQKVTEERSAAYKKEYYEDQIRKQQEILDRQRELRKIAEINRRKREEQNLKKTTANEPVAEMPVSQNEDTRNIGRAILSAIVGGLVFGVVFIAIRVVVAHLINFLSSIFLFEWLIDRFLDFRGESPDMFCCIVAAIVGVLLSMLVIIKISKSDLTYSLSGKILGITLILLHAISLVINLIIGEPVFPNIVQLMAGIILISFANKAT